MPSASVTWLRGCRTAGTASIDGGSLQLIAPPELCTRTSLTLSCSFTCTSAPDKDADPSDCTNSGAERTKMHTRHLGCAIMPCMTRFCCTSNDTNPTDTHTHMVVKRTVQDVTDPKMQEMVCNTAYKLPVRSLSYMRSRASHAQKDVLQTPAFVLSRMRLQTRKLSKQPKPLDSGKVHHATWPCKPNFALPVHGRHEIAGQLCHPAPQQ